MSFKVNNIFPYFNPGAPLFNINSINSIPISPPTTIEDGYTIGYDSTLKAFTFRNSFLIRGPTGPTGAQGSPGATGFEGERGVQGTTGLTGPIGLTGIQGTQGFKGDIGVPGPIGSQGVDGPTGPTGQRGPQGILGNVGSIGAPGMRGGTGNQGPQGYSSTGPTGPTGPAGPIGNNDPYFYCCPQWFNTECSLVSTYVNTENYVNDVLLYNQKKYIIDQYQQQLEFENFVDSSGGVGPFNMLYIGYGNILVFPNISNSGNTSNNNSFVYNTINKRVNYRPLPDINGIIGACLLKDNSVIFLERSAEADYDSANVYRYYPESSTAVRVINGYTYEALSNNDYRSPISLPNGNVVLTPGDTKTLIEFNPNIVNQTYADAFVYKETNLPSIYNFGLVTSSGNVLFFPASPYTQPLLYNPTLHITQECAYSLGEILTGCILPSGAMIVSNLTDTFIINEPDNPYSSIAGFVSSGGNASPILLPNSHLLFSTTTTLTIVGLQDFLTKTTISLPTPVNKNMKGLMVNKKYYYIDDDNNLNSVDFFLDEGFNDAWNTNIFINNYNTPYP